MEKSNVSFWGLAIFILWLGTGIVYFIATSKAFFWAATIVAAFLLGVELKELIGVYIK